LVSRALGVENWTDKLYIFVYILSYFIGELFFSLTAIRKQNQLNDLSLTFSLVFKSQLLLLVLTLPFLLIALLFIPDLKYNWFLTCISYIAVLGAFFDKNWIFQYKQDLKLVAIVNVLLKIISVVCIILFIKEEDYLLYAIILYRCYLFYEYYPIFYM
jgi:PST family polysaccharide transporter